MRIKRRLLLVIKSKKKHNGDFHCIMYIILSQPSWKTKLVFQIPATINQYLRDYQREGAQFMYNRYSEGEGCILGDDMGLGKTVQVKTT